MKSAGEERVIAGVAISHPDRLVFEPEHIAKVDLAGYVESAAPWMMPHVVDRPLMVLRCNRGVGPDRPCFVQKHPRTPRGATERPTRDPSDASLHLAIHDVEGLVRLVQNGAVEIHLWGATLARVERPDRMIFDLDPHEAVPWVRVVGLARELRARLRALRLPSYVKTTGGKGLHVCVPLQPRHEWGQVRSFSETVAGAIARDAPRDVTLDMSKSKRPGRIFLDVLRNVRGATSVAPYSPRARAGATISMPLSWEQLRDDLDPKDFSIATWTSIRARRRKDPWSRWESERARLPRLAR